MVLRISETNLIKLANQIIPLRAVIPFGSSDDFVYLLDIGYNESITAYLATPSSMPGGYMPADGVYLESQPNIEGDHTYSILLQGDWSIDDLGDFPKKFNKLYSILYGMNILREGSFETHPWRGGFSWMHFFNEAMSVVPPVDRPSIDAIHKSSPGFVRFSLNTQAAQEVVQCVLDFKSEERLIDETNATLRRYIYHHKLNDIRDPESPEWDFYNGRLDPLSRALIRHFGAIDESRFMAMCPRAFEAAKIALAFVKYVRDLVNYERQGLITFPRQHLRG